MGRATVDGLSISYEIIGDGRPWAIAPGGRFTKDYPGVRELAEALARESNQVLIWDRPNCGESDVCFTGLSESAMQADSVASPGCRASARRDGAQAAPDEAMV
jgi:hypothetical protein